MYSQYIVYVALAYTVALALFILTVYVWRRRAAAPAATPFAWLLALVCFWSLMNGIWILVPSQTMALVCYKLAYIGVAFSPVAWLVFTLQYTERVERLSMGYLALLAAVPLLTQIALWTNDMHTLFVPNLKFIPVGPFRIANTEEFIAGPLGLMHLIYSYLLILLGIILVAWKAIRSFNLYRGQGVALLVGIFLMTLGNVINTLGLIPDMKADVSSFGFALGGAAFAWALLRSRLFDVVPVARRIVIEGMGDGMLVLDMKGRLVDLNPAAQKIAALSPDQLGQTIPDQVRDQLLGAGSRGEVNVAGRWYDTRLMTLTDRQNNAAGQLIVLHDITERKQAEDEMRQAKEAAEAADRMKSNLVSMVSHDLRTPLNAILGYAEMLQELVYGPLTDTQHATLTRLLANGQRLLSLINDLLDQAQIEAGKLSLAIRPFKPAELLDGVMGVMGLLAQAKGLDLTTTIAPDLPDTLHGDQQRLHQILVNLVGNAIKFTEKGSVRIHLRRLNETQWAMAVSDTGPGIPPDQMQRTFERFYQVESDVTTRKHQGVGLGLAIVKQLVELMGGQVSVESEIGKGSTFTATLPITPPQNNQ